MLIVVTDAASLPVSMARVIAHCRAPEDGYDDDLLDVYLKSAVAYVEKHAGLILQPKEMQYLTQGWPCGALEVPAAPVRDVSAVQYLDENGALQTVDPADWTWVRTPEGATITFHSDFSLPTLVCDQKDRVRVTFTAGFDEPEATGSGDDPAYTLPPQAVVLLLVLTAHWYEKREAVASQETYKVPIAATELLAQLRIYR